MKYLHFQTFFFFFFDLDKELKMWELQVISFPNYDKKGRENLLNALKPDIPEVFMNDDEFFKKFSTK